MLLGALGIIKNAQNVSSERLTKTRHKNNMKIMKNMKNMKTRTSQICCIYHTELHFSKNIKTACVKHSIPKSHHFGGPRSTFGAQKVIENDDFLHTRKNVFRYVKTMVFEHMGGPETIKK